MAKTRVLIAEDDPVSLRVVETMLKKWGYDPVPARDGEEAWKALQAEGAPRLAILDWMMPRRDGPDVCRELRQQTTRPYTYVLLLTAKTQQQDLIDGLGSGADDYLTKPFSGEELKARLYSGERILAVQQQLMEAKEALRLQAIRDPLTGLYNRRYMEEALARELRRAQHGQHPLSVMMFDLDHFKIFNDTAGHQAGDHVLKYVSELLEGRTRREDIPCRYGGEEFVLILPGAPIHVAARRALEFRETIRESTIAYEGKALGRITVSIGVACFPQHGATGAELVGAADSALYRAKQEGRDRVIICDPAAMPAQAGTPDALRAR